MKLRGVFSVLPTPFLESAKAAASGTKRRRKSADLAAGSESVLREFLQSGDVDVESLRRVVELFLQAGVDGLTALGVTGEVARLSERERSLVLETVLGTVRNRAPVVAGTTADGLRTCIEYTRAARQAGASAVMTRPQDAGRPQ